MVKRHVFSRGRGRLGFMMTPRFVVFYLLFVCWSITRKEPKKTEYWFVVDFLELGLSWGFYPRSTDIAGSFNGLDTLLGPVDWQIKPTEEPWQYDGALRLMVQCGYVSKTRPALFPLQRWLGLVRKGFRVYGWSDSADDETTSYHFGEPDEDILWDIAKRRIQAMHVDFSDLFEEA